MIKLSEFERVAIKPPIESELSKAERKNGLTEKAYNGLKNVTNFGIGSKKVNKKIDEFKKGKISEEEVQKYITNYRKSQENAEQTFGDVLSAGAGIGAYFTLKNGLKKLQVQKELNAISPITKQFVRMVPKKLRETIEKVIKSKTKTGIIALSAAALVAGYTKLFALKLNRTGSKEFKIQSTEGKTKKEIKKEKKILRKARRKQNLKNFSTGMVNGLLSPVLGLAGGLAGIPAYLAATTGLRYKANGENKNKSLKDFTESLKDNAIVNALGLAAVSAIAFKNVNYSKVLFKNLEKVQSKLKEVKLKAPDLPSNKTAYEELEQLLVGSDSITRIKNSGLSVEQQITELTKENIFSVKFIQIRGDASSQLSKALKENCPTTRTLEEAQDTINQLLNSQEYAVSKLLGVGTVAESYLAKDKTGKEVCIKILKNGISKEKILADKEKFASLITKEIKPENLSEEQKYLMKNLDNLADGILKEVDFKNEMEAAKKLKNFTQKANVVRPIEAKPGVYIMEKANGISLDTLIRYWELETEKTFLEKLIKQAPTDVWNQRNLESINIKIAEIKAKAPHFDDFKLSDNEIKNILKDYVDVQVEQFNKVEKTGKTLHADIHPGNIFVDINAVKTKKGKIFTLIDTGNTIDLSKQQALNSIKLTNFIENGNTKDLTAYVLDGAVLPKGMGVEKAAELVENELKTIFFDAKTNIDLMHNDSLLKLTNNIMRKHSIIPNDTQLNLNKAKTSANNSFEGIIKSFFDRKCSAIDPDAPKAELLIQTAKLSKDSASILSKMKISEKLQEIKNLIKLPFKEMMKNLKNPNILKTNSEDYLTYKMKQNIYSPFSN